MPLKANYERIVKQFVNGIFVITHVKELLFD